MNDRKSIAEELYHAGDSLLSELEKQVDALQKERDQKEAVRAKAEEEAANAKKRLFDASTALRTVADKLEGRA